MPALATVNEVPAHKEYDPWEQYRTNVGKYRTVEQPYVDFLELQRGLDQAEARGVLPIYGAEGHSPTGSASKAQNEADELILKWCNCHGLLGLLSTLCSSIHMPAVVKRLPRRNMRIVTQEVHFRDGGTWFSSNDVGLPITATAAKLADADAQVELRQRPAPGVAWLDRASHVYEPRPLTFIRDFFPFLSRTSVKASFHPPCPNQGDFWAHYGEPVLQFRLWCRLFTRAVEHLSKWRGDVQASDWEKAAVDRSFRTLTGLAQSATPAFHFNVTRNHLYESRGSAGLLGSYALMFLWDRMDGRRALSCSNCSRFFVSNENRALYCCAS